MRTALKLLLLNKKSLWTPAQISTALWLDAADSSTIELDAVSVNSVRTWRDKSGNNRHALQPTNIGQPLYIVDGLNGRNVLDFAFKAMEAPLPNMPQFTYFVVYKHRSNPSNAFSNIGFIVDIGVVLTPTLNGRISQLSYNDTNFSTSQRATSVINTPLNSNWNIHETDNIISSAPGVNDGSLIYRLNSTTITTSVTNAGGVTGSPVIRIGAGESWAVPLSGLSYTSSSLQSDGLFAEVIVTTGSMSTLTRQKIEGYLAHKWGLTANLPISHPYKNSPP